jgi:hypothetical protein
MFDTSRIGVYPKELHNRSTAFTKVSYIGDEPISFIDAEYVDETFKKINVMVFIQTGNNVFVDDGKIPNVILSEFDLYNTYGVKTNDRIMQEAATRAAHNAGTTIAFNTLKLHGKIEGDDTVYYIYMCMAGKKLFDDVKTMPIRTLKKEHFLGQCTLDELIV